MTNASTESLYLKALGATLRTLRERKKVTREALVAPTSGRISIQTLGSWELGSRTMPISRLPTIARLLGTTPHEILTIVDAKVIELVTGTITVDLVRLSQLDEPALSYLARWADAGLKSGRRTATLSEADVRNLAELGGTFIDTVSLALTQASVGGEGDG